jgi:hypothetical protein
MKLVILVLSLALVAGCSVTFSAVARHEFTGPTVIEAGVEIHPE